MVFRTPARRSMERSSSSCCSGRGGEETTPVGAPNPAYAVSGVAAARTVATTTDAATAAARRPISVNGSSRKATCRVDVVCVIHVHFPAAALSRPWPETEPSTCALPFTTLSTTTAASLTSLRARSRARRPVGSVGSSDVLCGKRVAFVPEKSGAVSRRLARRGRDPPDFRGRDDPPEGDPTRLIAHNPAIAGRGEHWPAIASKLAVDV